nr:MAG TPA: protein of unknown function (DUF4566) [Caudoviricetes sp.]DAO98410.1 MAG TPA: protein of unknown function (DUF4566) [Bacteriophage sp.]DAT88584.1 MAG TPA: protein of unknown function (DUF4566) [Bacteriophage sp.]DAU98929.1 MAG TPA: protein of unknown function (DUF4566) [Bacteriophage sp.]
MNYGRWWRNRYTLGVPIMNNNAQKALSKGHREISLSCVVQIHAHLRGLVAPE